jgi:hypothetical protein
MPFCSFLFMGELIESFERRFAALDHRSRALIRMTPQDRLYWKPRELPRSMTMFSCGEYVLRSAGMVEKTFGGITTRLWDDPFEWTLPEELATKEAVLGYLSEVEVTRVRGFSFFKADDNLLRKIPAPANLRSIFDILLETIAQAEHYQGRALAIFQMFSDEKLPRL